MFIIFRLDSYYISILHEAKTYIINYKFCNFYAVSVLFLSKIVKCVLCFNFHAKISFLFFFIIPQRQTKINDFVYLITLFR